MFFGSVLKQGQSYTFDENEVSKGDVLNISNAVLASGNKAELYIKSNAQDYLVAILTQSHPYVTLNIHLGVLDKVQLHVKDSGTIHVVGLYQNEVDDEDLDMADEKDESEEAQVWRPHLKTDAKSQPKTQTNLHHKNKGKPLQNPQQPQQKHQHQVTKTEGKTDAKAATSPKQTVTSPKQHPGAPKHETKASVQKPQRAQPQDDGEVDKDDDDDVADEGDDAEISDDDEDDEDQEEGGDEIDDDIEAPRKQIKGNDNKSVTPKPQQQKAHPQQQQHQKGGQQHQYQNQNKNQPQKGGQQGGNQHNNKHQQNKGGQLHQKGPHQQKQKTQ